MCIQDIHHSLWLSSLQGGILLCSGVCYLNSVSLVPHNPKAHCADGFISLI